jgi:hypothetical protein
MRTSTLVILAGGLLAATTVKWSDPNLRRTLGGIYREAKAGRLRSSLYDTLAGWASLILLIVGMYLAFSGK